MAEDEDKKTELDVFGNGKSLKNRLLISTPVIAGGDIFSNSIIYVCEHNASGAMGIVLNQKITKLNFEDILRSVDIGVSLNGKSISVYFGGPLEVSRGFVLHSTDFIGGDTKLVNDRIALTSTVDVIRRIVESDRPEKVFFALGHAGWGPGQLEREIYDNSWFVADFDEDLIFNQDISSKWKLAVTKLGINDPANLSGTSGHA